MPLSNTYKRTTSTSKSIPTNNHPSTTFSAITKSASNTKIKSTFSKKYTERKNPSITPIAKTSTFISTNPKRSSIWPDCPSQNNLSTQFQQTPIPPLKGDYQSKAKLNPKNLKDHRKHYSTTTTSGTKSKEIFCPKEAPIKFQYENRTISYPFIYRPGCYL